MNIPDIHPMGPLTFPGPKRCVLANGATLDVLSRDGLDVNRLTIAINGGKLHGDNPELALMAIDMLNQGSKNFTGKEISDILELNGSWVKAQTYLNHRAYVAHSLNSTMDSILPVIEDAIVNPIFPEDAVESLRTRKAKALERELQKVSVQSKLAMDSLLYGENNLLSRQSTVEWFNNVARQDLQQFHSYSLNPQCVHAYLAGGIGEKVFEQVKNLLERIPSIGPGYAIISPDASPMTERSKFVQVKGAVQSAITIGMPTIGRDNPDYVQLRALVMALGGYFGSRLMLNIREEKGLTYGIQAELLGFKNMGSLLISTQTANENKVQVIDEVTKELELLKNPSSYTTTEIERLKGFLLTNLAQVLDTPMSLMDWHETRQFAGTPDDYFYLSDKVARGLTPEILAETARKHFDSSLLKIAFAGN